MTRTLPSASCRGGSLSVERAAIEISWLGPTHRRDRDSHAEWCETVGPIVWKPAEMRPPAGWAPGAPLAVVTWNMHGTAGDLVDFVETEFGYECDRDASAAALPFVLLVQEALRRGEEVPPVVEGVRVPNALSDQPPWPSADIVEAAERCDLSLFFAPSMRNGTVATPEGREDRGNAILSTLPLTDPIAIELPFETQRRVAIAATVRDVGGDSLRLVSLHLDTTSGFLRTLRTGNSTRLRQALGLVDALRAIEMYRLRQGSEPAECYPSCEAEELSHTIGSLVAGDLNTFADDQTVILHLLRLFPGSPTPDGEPTRGLFPADHVFFRTAGDGRLQLDPASYRRIERPHGSDHLARRVTVSAGDADGRGT